MRNVRLASTVSVVCVGLLFVATAHAGAKVEVCHIPPKDPASSRTIRVKEKAVPKHLNHGGLLGPCGDQPAPTVCEPDPDPFAIRESICERRNM